MPADHVPCQIRLITSHASSAETIRLWLERSGRTVPLDIEIILRSHPTADGLSRRRYLSLPPPHAAGDWVPGGGWTTPPPLLHTPPTPAAGGTTAVHLQIGGAHQSVHVVPVQAVVPADTAPSSPPYSGEWDMPPLLANPERTVPSQRRLRKNMHWGHIAFYYLVEQMHRWERFIFRFDKQFLSIAALKAIEGELSDYRHEARLSRCINSILGNRRCSVAARIRGIMLRSSFLWRLEVAAFGTRERTL